jgi:4'-phosphopantetheinyl transferase
VGDALHFNLSHSRDLALCACTRLGEIGVDVEHIHPLVDMDRIAHRIFSESDYRVWVRLPEQLRQTTFYKCWTQKEALIKACGSGLSQPMNQIAVPVLAGESSSLISWNGNCEQASDWSMCSFTPEPETIAACALQARQMTAAYFTWVDK